MSFLIKTIITAFAKDQTGLKAENAKKETAEEVAADIERKQLERIARDKAYWEMIEEQANRLQRQKRMAREKGQS